MTQQCLPFHHFILISLESRKNYKNWKSKKVASLILSTTGGGGGWLCHAIKEYKALILMFQSNLNRLFYILFKLSFSYSVLSLPNRIFCLNLKETRKRKNERNESSK